MTQDELKAYIIAKANEAWVDKEPYLLARLSPELFREKDVRYRDVVAPLTLKQFAAQIPELDVIQHPNFKAQVGVIPKGQVYEFASKVDESQSEALSHKKNPTNSRFIVMRFLELLNELDDSTLESVNIPVRVLARLSGRK